MAILNEPFEILDNIPLIWCFASFETCRSGVLEIATQRRGLSDAPQPTQVSSAFSALQLVRRLVHFHTNHAVNLHCYQRLGRFITAQVVHEFAGKEEKKGEMKSEEGMRVIACPTRGACLGKRYSGCCWRYVINFSWAIIFQKYRQTPRFHLRCPIQPMVPQR